MLNMCAGLCKVQAKTASCLIHLVPEPPGPHPPPFPPPLQSVHPPNQLLFVSVTMHVFCSRSLQHGFVSEKQQAHVQSLLLMGHAKHKPFLYLQIIPLDACATNANDTVQPHYSHDQTCCASVCTVCKLPIEACATKLIMSVTSLTVQCAIG